MLKIDNTISVRDVLAIGGSLVAIILYFAVVKERGEMNTLAIKANTQAIERVGRRHEIDQGRAEAKWDIERTNNLKILDMVQRVDDKLDRLIERENNER